MLELYINIPIYLALIYLVIEAKLESQHNLWVSQHLALLVAAYSSATAPAADPRK